MKQRAAYDSLGFGSGAMEEDGICPVHALPNTDHTNSDIIASEFFSFLCVSNESIKCQSEGPKDSGQSIYGIDNRTSVFLLSSVSTESTFLFFSL